MQGLPLSEGLAVGSVCMFNEHRHSNLPMYRVEGEGLERELERVRRAMELVAVQLDKVHDKVARRIGKAEAEIFTAQKMILQDRALYKDVGARIRSEKINAESAVAQSLNEYERRMGELDHDYMRERASDFGEIKRRVLDVLGDMRASLQCAPEHCQRGRDRIVVAEELTPSLTIEVDMEHTVGFVTEHGGVNSHAAILARSLGVPAVSGLEGIRDQVGCGAEILLNGDTGVVTIWPSKEAVARVRSEQDRPSRRPDPVPPLDEFTVMANINTVADLRETNAMQADGIGLYRTEYDLLVSGRLFSEEELYQRYAAAVEAMAGRHVYFRIFDIGSDKKLPFLKLPPEENPALGWRGARLLLHRPDLLKPQARALVRAAAHGPVHVMYPMIVEAAQFLELKQAFNQCADDLPQGEMRHGIMFEVPSACLEAETLYRHIDFASVGSNDLTQYLFAVDRDNDRVSSDYQPDRPVFWALLARIAAAAAHSGKPLSVCGEMAGNPRYTAKLIEVGIRSVSVSPRRIPGVRTAALAAHKRIASEPAEKPNQEDRHGAELQCG